VREVVAAYLRMVPDAEVCGSADSGEIALTMLGTIKPDIVLVDLSLSGMSGIELIATMRARYPDTCALVLSAHAEPRYVEAAFAAGACGYVLKGNPADLRAAIEAARSGVRYLSPGLQPDA
jgi:DNA-binding NarL/FixJ family response regulator